MRHAVSGKVRIILGDDELSPPGEVAVFQVAFLAQDDAVMQ